MKHRGADEQFRLLYDRQLDIHLLYDTAELGLVTCSQQIVLLQPLGAKAVVL